MECNAILLREFKQPLLHPETGELLTFETLRRHPETCGFTHAYLKQSKAWKIDVKMEVIIQLAKNDLKRGATLAEIVCSCCEFLPTIELVDESGVYLFNAKYLKFIFSLHKFLN